jgi:large repetitive protein
MAFRPWSRLFCFALVLATTACGGGSGGGGAGDGGAGGEGGAGFDGPALSVSDASIREGNTSARELTFTVSLSSPSDEVIKVSYETQDGTAEGAGDGEQGGRDFDPKSATLRFEPGETEHSFSVAVNGDRFHELDETFKIVLSKPIAAPIADGEGEGTIEDDDSAPSLSIFETVVAEGNSGSKTANLTVTLSETSTLPISVQYDTVDVSAVDGEDYIGTSGTLTFAPGETRQTIAVSVEGDTVLEPDESLKVVLSEPVNASLNVSEGTLLIGNDDSEGASLSIDDATVSEGSSGIKTLSFVISLSQATDEVVTVDYATLDGTATASGLAATGGFDYTSTSDSVSFAPGETQKQVDVTINGDTLNEGDETFLVELFNGSSTVVDPQGQGTISNDDSMPSLLIGDVSVDEGAAGTRMATFLVSLSAASGRTVSIDYETEDYTASAGTDYTAASGTLAIPAGQTYGYVSVTVSGDSLDEASEQFYVTLSGEIGVTVVDRQAVGTISNDDSAPTLSISDTQVVEGDANSKNTVFTVSLSAASGQSISVDWATANDTADAGSDYGAGSGTLIFAAGVTVQTINVAVYGDTQDEPNETFVVDLTDALGASLADDQGVATIVTDDSTLPALNINDVSVSEGNTGSTTLSFTVSLEFAVGQQVTVDYETVADSALSGTDFEAASSTLTFLPNEISKTIEITVNGDTLHEPDEGLWVGLSGAANAFVADGYGYGIIEDDDNAPTLSVSDASVSEGNSGVKNATFTISLSAASGFPISVAYATADGTALEGGAASLGQDDYEASSDVVDFAPGITSAMVSVVVNGDLVPEGNEAFLMQLSAPQNASLLDAQGQGSISNDDAVPSLSIDDVSALEGDAGSKTFTFTVTLSGPSGGQVTVDFDTANGTAVSGSDYEAASGTVTFAAGQTTATIAVTVLGEKAAEAHNDETFYVNLSNPVAASAGDMQGLGTIVSDD